MLGSTPLARSSTSRSTSPASRTSRSSSDIELLEPCHGVALGAIDRFQDFAVGEPPLKLFNHVPVCSVWLAAKASVLDEVALHQAGRPLLDAAEDLRAGNARQRLRPMLFATVCSESPVAKRLLLLFETTELL